jgi:hypothetical protein
MLAGWISTEEVPAMAVINNEGTHEVPGGQGEDGQKRRDDMLRHQYDQVCASYRAIDDFRGKLLALWPILGGAAGGVALLAASRTNWSNLWAVGLFGFFVSLGVALYEWNQTLRCDQLKKVARRLEEDMDLETAQFLTLPPGFKVSVKTPPLPVARAVVKRLDDQEQRRELEPPGRKPMWWEYPVSVGVASSIVYGAVILGWMALFVWGLLNLNVADGACPQAARPF